MNEPVPYVIDSADDVPVEAIFRADREQVVLAIRITPVYGQVNLGLLMRLVDEANKRDFALAREQLCPRRVAALRFEAYEED